MPDDILAQALKWVKKNPVTLIIAGVTIYLLTRWYRLTSLPVFADEAIYIRWAQLILHDRRYLFFALNDGKPPLYVWSLLPGLMTSLDPLWISRSMSVITGLLAWYAGDKIVQLYAATSRERLAFLPRKQLARFVFGIIYLFAPFWFFHQRMALMDLMLVNWLMFSWWGLLRLHNQLSSLSNKATALNHYRQLLTSSALAGVSWGLALWTKTPALFWAPVFVLYAVWPWINQPKHWPTTSQLISRLLWFGLAGFLGLSWLGLLRISPAFGSLWGRSSDFTFSLAELLSGQWKVSIDNMGRIISWLSAYLRPEVLSLPFIALLISQHKRQHWQIMLASSVFFFPLAIMGKTLHPRYFLPLAPFISVSAALLTTEAVFLLKKSKNDLIWLVFWLLTFSFFLASWRFMLLSFYTPNQTPFVWHDREQYLTEWSSGHGVTQVRDQAISYTQPGKRLTIVTEGSFGTLPDALLMYFDRHPAIKNLRIEGLAQYPVTNIPDWVWEDAAQHETWLVVNSHRLQLPPSQQEKLKLIAKYPRPYGGPYLLVFQLQSR